jgi:MoxR-like ATPase
MTAWPPEIPDPFDPSRLAFGRKVEGTWGKMSPETPELEDGLEEEETALGEPATVAEPVPEDLDDIEQSAEHFRSRFLLLKEEIQKVLVGQDEIIEHVITALIAGGHVLLEGVPGQGKTTLVRSMSEALSLFFQRVQFTPDLEPADLVGVNRPGHLEMGEIDDRFVPGPLFCNLLLADHINRAPPRTQVVLLQAMEEKCVTVEGQTRLLAEPFFVLATQNPVEEGTYLLPTSQIDRFFFSLPLASPTIEEMETILERTTESAAPVLEPAFAGEDLVLMRDFARGVLVEPALRRQIAELVTATHPGSELSGATVKKYVRFGASPRAGQALVMAAKIRALREGRFYVTTEDVVTFAIGVLRHRIVLTPQAQADGLTVEEILTKILEELYQHWGE